ncbi:MAG: molybdate ABC transporter substrate-binding protein [Bacteroidetes bacterium]|nr:molybdate ABC transporter substrate-binding protein [Bacteroidota bacterium]
MIATSANMRYAMGELVKSFTAQSGISCEIVVGSSGNLTAQIREGAPYDVFVSADMQYPETLSREGVSKNSPEVYALGKLVLWTTIPGLHLSPDSLNQPMINHIAIANPETAPYGRASMEVLNYYRYDSTLSKKLVIGESISQTSQFVFTRSAEVGFTAKSVVLSPEMKNKGNWIELKEETYSPIRQGVILIDRKNAQAENAQKFYDFLFSPQARAILSNYGYQSSE